MFEIEIKEKRTLWDERNEQFVYVDPKKIVMEHSLISLSRWESKYKKPFLERLGSKKDPLTESEIFDYFRFMVVTPNVDPNFVLVLKDEEIRGLQDYINDTHTATTINGKKENNRSNFVTSELIYYWMIECNVWIECEKWNLNRLMTLIQVVSEERKPKEKMSQADLAAKYSAMNKARNAARKQKIPHIPKGGKL